jgi:hypothetical protein
VRSPLKANRVKTDSRSLPGHAAPVLGFRATIAFMPLAIFFIRLLEVMFFLGLAGSAIVILISFFEDFKELFGED